jgi:tetratricopeptide (TPR) repeat protein
MYGHIDLGDLLSETPKLADADAELRTAIEIGQELAEANPANTDIQVLLANSHRRLGYSLSLAGKLSQAASECRTALAINQKLAGDDPAKTYFRSNLALSHNALGCVLQTADEPLEAEAELRYAVAILQEQEGPLGDSGLADGLVNLGDAVRALGRPAEAKSGYERAITLLKRQVEQEPTNRWSRRSLAYAIRRRGLALSGLGDTAGAAAEARRGLGLLEEMAPQSVEDFFEMACCHAALAGLDEAGGSNESHGQGQTQANQAIDLVRRAIGLGFRNLAAIRAEAALGSLRDRDDFRLMIMDLAMPTEPFAAHR